MKKQLQLQDFVDGFKKKDIAILSRAITLVESKNIEHQKLARQIIDTFYKQTGKAKRIGISGTPGVGKSTFIDTFGMSLIDAGLKVAVLAIDPTSQKTGGSILGDKTRMHQLAASKEAFIRPSPSGTTLGGVASKTRESMLLCEAFGFDVVIVETVGVGQSEVTVSQMVDFFLLLMQPGGGDDLQGIKRGILEVADLVAVNKADGDQQTQASIALQEYSTAIKILHHGDSAWTPKVIKCSGLKGIGLDEIWNSVLEYYKIMEKDQQLQFKRDQQLKSWMWSMLMEKVENELTQNDQLNKKLLRTQQELIENKLNIMQATQQIFDSLTHMEK
jgi:LAO/AO transport system kinase